MAIMILVMMLSMASTAFPGMGVCGRRTLRGSTRRASHFLLYRGIGGTPVVACVGAQASISWLGSPFHPGGMAPNLNAVFEL